MNSSVIKFCAIFVLFGAVAADEENPVSDVCLKCICEATSGCSATPMCKGESCGAYRITRAYWIDAGELTIDGKLPDDDDAFETCIADPTCAVETIQSYMSDFGQDCNDDGKIDCQDYMAIHLLGGYDCSTRIPFKYTRDFNKCMAAAGQA